jgi:Carboxypeptidase regulatory-like domain
MPVAVALIVLLATIATRAEAPTGRIAGTVRDDDGRAVPWTSITATCGDVSATATTNIPGRFQIDSVPIGTCRLLVVAPSSEVVVRQVMVPAGGTAAASVEVSTRDQPKRSGCLAIDRVGR